MGEQRQRRVILRTRKNSYMRGGIVLSERMATLLKKQGEEIEKVELQRDQWKTRALLAEERIKDLEILVMQFVGRAAETMQLHVKSLVPERKKPDGH